MEPLVLVNDIDRYGGKYVATKSFKDNDVLVTYKDGMVKGMTIRYTITDQNIAQTSLDCLSA